MPPNFFIVGAPKAGTTSLYHYLNQHPQIYMCPVKEPCHFAREVNLENFSPAYKRDASRDARDMENWLRGPRLEKRFSGYVPEWTDYLSLFDAAREEIAIGEASVCYLWSPTAARNIAMRLPNARIIAILRHPVERAWSQYRHGIANGYVKGSFRRHIETCLNSSDKKFSPHYPFLEFGLYSGQIRTYLELFPRENVRVCFYQDGFANIVADLLRFLNVEPAFQVDLSARHLDSSAAEAPTVIYRTLRRLQIWQSLRSIAPRRARSVLRQLAFRKHPPALMNDSDRRFLCHYYMEDVSRLAALLERDLTSWLV